MKTILVCGHGPGISNAVAKKFAAEGFAVGLVARSKDKLEAAAAELAKGGAKAKALPCDLSDPAAVKAMVAAGRDALGPIAAIHWNAYAGGAGDLTTADPAGIRRAFDVSVTGMVAATQAALADLEAQKGALLVTGGGFAFYDKQVDAMAVQFNAMDLAIGKAAQHKAVGLLHEKLAPKGVYVGEVVVMGVVKGTAFDAGGHGTLEAPAIANKLWELYAKRSERTVNFG